MPRRRRSSFSAFGMYSDWAQAGMRAGEMFFSSAEVIGYRSRMIADAMSGGIALTDAEFLRMWQEKFSANMDACAALMHHASAPMGPPSFNDMGAMLHAPLQALEAMTRPYHRKVTANARRLRKKK